MSTRDQRREWQEFREKHGETEREFRKKWDDMFNRAPTAKELKDYTDMKKKLKAPLGRKPKKEAPYGLKASSASPLKCDGNHAEPVCTDKECWLRGDDDMIHIEGRRPPLVLPSPRVTLPSGVQEPIFSEVTHRPIALSGIVTVTKRYEWDMGHRLPNHNGKCARLHGHRYVAEIDITGPVHTSGPQEGMVVDFYLIKDLLDSTVGHWDHKTMLYRGDTLLVGVILSGQVGAAEDLGIFFVDFVPTAENIAREILSRMNRDNLHVTRVRVYETPSGWAEVKA